jgi:hypothetical protein
VTVIDRFFLRLDRLSDTQLLIGVVAAVVLLWTIFALSAAVVLS